MSTAAAVEVRKRQRQGHGRPNQYVVLVDGVIVGLLERYSGPCSYYPWHAYVGTGREAEHLGCWYPNESKVPLARLGGRDAAVAAILAARSAAA